LFFQKGAGTSRTDFIQIEINDPALLNLDKFGILAANFKDGINLGKIMNSTFHLAGDFIFNDIGFDEPPG